MLSTYAIEYMFDVPQWGQPTRRYWPMALRSFAVDTAAVADRLESCRLGRYDDTRCARAVLDDLAVIFQTFTVQTNWKGADTLDQFELRLRGIITQHVIQIGGRVKYLNKGPFVGNVIPLNDDMYLVTDWLKSQVTLYIAPFYRHSAKPPPHRKARFEHTVSLPNNGGIGGITRDAEHLIVRMARNEAIHFYSLTDFIVPNDSSPQVKHKMVPKCQDATGNLAKVYLNEIEYEPISGTLWGVPRNSSRIMEFNIRSGKCVGEFDLVTAMYDFFEEKVPGSSIYRELKLVRNSVGKLYRPRWTVVNGITFLAENWIMVSPWNESSRYILKINRSSPPP